MAVYENKELTEKLGGWKTVTLADGPSQGESQTVLGNQTSCGTFNPDNTIYHTYVVMGDEAWYMKSGPIESRLATTFEDEAKQFESERSEIKAFMARKHAELLAGASK